MRKIIIIFAIGVLGISIFPVLVRLKVASGITTAFYRMFIALVLLLPYMILTKKLKKYDLKTTLLMLLCGVVIASDVMVWNISIQGSSAVLPSLLSNLSPIWVGIFSLVFLIYKPTRSFWIGMGITLIGLFVFLGISNLSDINIDRYFMLGVLSGIFYSIYVLLSKKALGYSDVLNFLTYTLIGASTVSFTFCMITDSQIWGFDTRGWIVLITQGIVSQLIAWICLNYTLQHLPATRVSLGLLSQVVVTAILAWWFLGEEITANMMIGGLIVLLGIATTFMMPSRR